jgi:hypothetical protein
MPKISLLYFCMFFIISACQKQTPFTVSAGYTYFPLQKGAFTEYEVSQTSYGLTNTIITNTYYLKEKVGDSYTDLTGKESYHIERYKRTTNQQPWALDSVWTASLQADKALRNENNSIFVKMLFPLQKGLRWNGNLYNSAGLDTYEVESMNKTTQVKDLRFDNTLIIKQKNDSSAVSLDRRYEYYATNIGLIYRERTQFAYCYTTDCLGKGKIEYGVKQIQKIINYGKE